ncbi:MAG: hypothetical protein ABIH34_03630 [Nanoarchaeota archaeon]
MSGDPSRAVSQRHLRELVGLYPLVTRELRTEGDRSIEMLSSRFIAVEADVETVLETLIDMGVVEKIPYDKVPGELAYKYHWKGGKGSQSYESALMQRLDRK